MPKVGEMMKKGKFLKKEDLEELGGEVVGTIVGVKEMNVAMENQPEALKWVMKLRELDQLFVLNNTNLQLIEKALKSDDTADWRGKQITLYVDDNVTMGNKLVGGIRVRVPRDKPATAKRAAAASGDEPDHEATPQTEKRQPKFEDFEDDIPF